MRETPLDDSRVTPVHNLFSLQTAPVLAELHIGRLSSITWCSVVMVVSLRCRVPPSLK